MPIEGYLEKTGIADLMLNESNTSVLEQLARSLTKNVVDIGTNDEALDVLFMHTPTVQLLLNKKLITKEILFKYVHNNQISVTSDFTKAILINKIIEFWKSGGHLKKSNTPSQSTGTLNHGQIQETEYPIHLMARQFSKWFYEKYNSDSLKTEDFWKDSRLTLGITASDSVDEKLCESAEQVIETLQSCKQQFNLFFNPNLSHEGVQGRMDVHGLVIVLVCGTLHTQDSCVGVFETSFGLMRDPFALNNWKIKNIQSLLRSQGTPSEPRLSESDTLKASLALPAPMGEIL